ncbi:MAG: hypothetical protein IKI19_07675, partial [Prevotella sp.]|nr:hypothetical protein [Prevotella sp.]
IGVSVRGKHHAFWVGSDRPHDWQRPLPMMAAVGNNDGSGRCQPVFTPYPYSLVIDAKYFESLDKGRH